MSKHCYWQSSRPTMGEMTKRAQIVASTIGASEWGLMTDRAAGWAIRGHERVQFALMTVDELNAGEWVHADPHAGECPELAFVEVYPDSAVLG